VWQRTEHTKIQLEVAHRPWKRLAMSVRQLRHAGLSAAQTVGARRNGPAIVNITISREGLTSHNGTGKLVVVATKGKDIFRALLA